MSWQTRAKLVRDHMIATQPVVDLNDLRALDHLIASGIEPYYTLKILVERYLSEHDLNPNDQIP